jgi:hypothetical protein
MDFSAVTDAEHDNVVARYVEDHAIITDAETAAAEFRVGQPFAAVLERIVVEAKEGRADALYNGFLLPSEQTSSVCTVGSCVDLWIIFPVIRLLVSFVSVTSLLPSTSTRKDVSPSF